MSGRRAATVDRVENADWTPSNRYGWPNGPWLLVALAAVAIAMTGWGWATMLPADPRWFWLAGLGSAGAAVCLAAAARRDRDGFAFRWRATIVGLISLIAMTTSLGLAVDESVPMPVVLASMAGLVGWWAGAVATLALAAIQIVGRRWDGLVALALLVGTMVGLGSIDPLAMRLQGPAGDRLAAEAEALSSDPAAIEMGEGASTDPFVVAGTGRRVVAWKIPQFDTETPLLVHDPDGRLAVDDLPALLDYCGHITGPWWSCTYG